MDVEILSPLRVKKGKHFVRKISSSSEDSFHSKSPNSHREKNYSRILNSGAVQANRKKRKIQKQLPKKVHDYSRSCIFYSDVESEVSFSDFDYSSDEEWQVNVPSPCCLKTEKKVCEVVQRDLINSISGSGVEQQCSSKKENFFQSPLSENHEKSIQFAARTSAAKLCNKSENDNFRISRSGRIIKPRLVLWSDERLSCSVNDSQLKTVGMSSGPVLLSSRNELTPASSSFDEVLLQSPNAHCKNLTLLGATFSEEINKDCSYTKSSFESPLTPLHCRRVKNRFRVIDSSNESEKSYSNEKVVRRKKRYKKHKWRIDERKIRTSKTRKSNAKKNYESIKQKANEKATILTESRNVDNIDEQIIKLPICPKTNNVTRSKKVPELPKTWKKNELERLKLALNSIKPSSSEDWQHVAVAIGGGRSVAECEEIAIKKLNYQKKVADNDENEIELKECAGALFKAKVGSLSYLVHAQRFTRKFLMSEAKEKKSQNDCFDYNTIAEMPSVAHFDPDDSLLDVLRTPEVYEVRKANRREFVPKLPMVSCSLTPQSSSSEETDEKERDRKQRYVHHMLRNRVNGIYDKGSILSASARDSPTVDPGTLIKDAVKKLRKSRIKHYGIEEQEGDLVSDHEDENDDDILMNRSGER